MRTLILLPLVPAILHGAAAAAGTVHHRALSLEGAPGRSIISNKSFEDPTDATAGWSRWGSGFEVDRTVAHGGSVSAMCTRTADSPEMGVQRGVELNQQKPAMVIVTAWSKARDVTGSPNSGYSLYIDAEYVDGTSQWGVNTSFDTGTHDWQQRRVVLQPTKPVRRLTFYGLLRWHEGTAWFDDFDAVEIEPGSGAVFDLTAVEPCHDAALEPAHHFGTRDGLALDFASDGTLVADGRPGGFLVRDVRSQSDVRRLEGAVDGQSLSLRDDTLGLSVEATISPGEHGIRIDGTLADRDKAVDRAITLYFALPIGRQDLTFWDDPRRSRPVSDGGEFSHTTPCQVGATGGTSLYPFAAVAGRDGVAVGTPLAAPRLLRLAYNADTRELFAAVDLCLSPRYSRLPSAADFSLVLFRFEPQWGFRAALERYYALFPDEFAVRARDQGIWMPFSAISNVGDWQNFGFKFKEGNDEPQWDREHGIDTFVYVEPSSHWLAMPKELARTPESALDYLKANLANPRHQATLTSGITDPQGKLWVSIENAPWCDGALFLLSPAPTVSHTAELPTTQFDILSRGALDAVFPAGGATTCASWEPYGAGYSYDLDAAHDANASIKVVADGTGAVGARQSVALDQTEAQPLVLSGWSRAEGVAGGGDADYSLYVDCVCTDGTPSYAHLARFSGGTHDWERGEARIALEKPIKWLTLHCILRAPSSGTAWFDDLSLTVEGSQRNLLANPSFESRATPGELAGTYVDSLEMGVWTPDYSPEHIAACTIPPTFDSDGRPVLLHGWSVFEFTRWLAETMHGRGKMTFANAAFWTMPWYAGHFDVVGTETNFGPPGQYVPNGDDIFLYRRALSGGKPYLLLMNTPYDQFGHESVEHYFARSLFYGCYPSMFSYNAADDPYWQKPAWYNRDRDLFVKYIPLVKRVAEAGWQPVTLAESDNPRVLIERWGKADRTAFTVTNDSADQQQATVTLDLPGAGLDPAVGLRDLVSGSALPSVPGGGALSITLDPWQTMVIAAD